MQTDEKLSSATTVDPDEIDRFGRLGAEWWDPHGPMQALHKLNPVRVVYVRELLCRQFPTGAGLRDKHSPTPLQDLAILDIGCGAGILSEPLARLGARMTSIDPSRQNIETAKEHATRTGLSIDYRCTTAEALAAEGARFDAVLAMEVIEHVRDVKFFVQQAAAMVRPGGMLFAATLNRTWKSFAFGIVGAEYVLGWLPRGTHSWNRFVTPEELAADLRAAGLRIADEMGAVYDPLARKWRLSHDMDINYMIAARRPEQGA
jgi:2-polyprenyl-6-hydroxyphenyl methylase/3-demethylubiquinone-9 3-methyltransferase